MSRLAPTRDVAARKLTGPAANATALDSRHSAASHTLWRSEGDHSASFVHMCYTPAAPPPALRGGAAHSAPSSLSAYFPKSSLYQLFSDPLVSFFVFFDPASKPSSVKMSCQVSVQAPPSFS